MNKITKICGWCEKEFLVEKRETKRGGGKFYSLSCSAFFQNYSKEPIQKICNFCQCSYLSTAKHSLYCTKTCTNKARRSRIVKAGGKPKNRSQLQIEVIRKLGDPEEFKCFICGWSEAACDIHHIIPQSLGGSNSFDNLTVLCPNHHRLADRKKLTTLPSVSARYRTISSSNR